MCPDASLSTEPSLVTNILSRDIITGKPEKAESILNTIPTLWVAFYDW